MKFLELKDSISRFRFAQACVGLAGCICICYATWAPFWLEKAGLWNVWIDPKTKKGCGLALEAARVFAVLTFPMAVGTGALCMVVVFCWAPRTVRSYSPTGSPKECQPLYPTSIMQLSMIFTGFFFLLSWSLFTFQYQDEIYQDFSILGSSYWISALGWFLLLVVEAIVFLAEWIIFPHFYPHRQEQLDPNEIQIRVVNEVCAEKC